jgi:hypothetical protein
MEFDNIETIKRAVEIDAGIALLPEPTVLREVETGSLVMVPLDSDELVRPLGIIHRRGKELGSTTRRFIELLQNEGQQVCDDCFATGEHAHPAHHANGASDSYGASDAPGTNGTDSVSNHETQDDESHEDENHDDAADRPRRAARVKAK